MSYSRYNRRSRPITNFGCPKIPRRAHAGDGLWSPDHSRRPALHLDLDPAILKVLALPELDIHGHHVFL